MQWVTQSIDTPVGQITSLFWDATEEVEDEVRPELDPAEDQLGAVLWNSNWVFVEYLLQLVGAKEGDAKNKPFKGLNFVELGAGVGSLGVAIAVGGGNIAVTDIKELLPLMKKNVALNEKEISAAAGKCAAFAWSWGEPTPSGLCEQFTQRNRKSPVIDYVILCDALYGNKKEWPKLIATMHNIVGMAEPGTTFINFCEQRVTGVEDDFVELLRRDECDGCQWAIEGPTTLPQKSGLELPIRATVWKVVDALHHKRHNCGVPEDTGAAPKRHRPEPVKRGKQE